MKRPARTPEPAYGMAEELTDDDEAEQHPSPEQLAAEAAERRLRRSSAESVRRWYVGGSAHTTDWGDILEAHRDINLFYPATDRDGVRIARLLPAGVRRIREESVETPSDERLRALVAQEYVAFCRGSRDTGRQISAFAALIATVPPERLGAERAPVARLLLRSDPIALTGDDLEKGVLGYVLDATDHPWARRPSEAIVDHLRKLAFDAGARMVVLLGRGSELREGVVDHVPPPPDEVFRSRLRYELRSRRLLRPEPWIERVCGDERVTEALAGSPPQGAVDLAVAVAVGAEEDRPLADALTVSRERVLAEVRSLLARENPLRERCFLVSSAVLNGMPAVVVSKGALDLAQLIVGDGAGEQREPAVPAAWEQIQDWLDFAQAEPAPAERGGDGRIVRLRRPVLAEAVVEVVWEDHPTVRRPLLTWLGQLAGDKANAVRIKAAQAIGRLATYNFDVINAEFLGPWSSSNSVGKHRLVAWALETAAPHPEMSGRIRTLVQRWAGRGRSRRSVAARAYGSTIGMRWPDEALRAFARISLAPGDFPLQGAVARSVADIFHTETAELILRSLAEWATSESPGRRRAAALAFNRLAARPEAEDERPSLWDLAEDETHRNRFVVLWRNALNCGVVLRSAYLTQPRHATHESWDVLADWIAACGRRPTLLPVIEGVCTLPEHDRALCGPLRLHLLLLRSRTTISDDLYAHLTALLKEK